MSTLNLAADIPDIPYIEDEDGYSTLNAQLPIRTNRKQSDQPPPPPPTRTFSSSTQSATQSSYKDKEIARRTIECSTSDKPFTSTIERAVAMPPSSASTSTSGMFQSRPILSTEPKVSASITNIGGDVMRSKTADFEKLLSQNRRSSKSTSTNSSPFEASDLSRSSSTTEKYSSNFSQNSAANAKRSGPIYKRRDVISSAQTTKK